MKLTILNPKCRKFKPKFSQLSDYLVYRNNINYCINQEYINNILIYNR